MADACKVDALLAPGEVVIADMSIAAIPAPGHAPNQVMVAGGGACFVADAVFAPDVLQKHGIPFMVDLDAWLATLSMLPQLDGQYAAFVPGHGPAVPSLAAWAVENADRLTAIRASVEAALAQTDDLGQIIALSAASLGLTIAVPVTFWLTQTAVLACLASLQRAGKAQPLVESNRLRWRLNTPPAAAA